MGADELNLKGLSGNKNTREEPTKPMPTANIRKQSPTNFEPKTEDCNSFELKESLGNEAPTNPSDTVVAVPSFGISSQNISDVQELDEQVNSMMKKSENLCKSGSKKAYTCTVCGKEGQGRDIKDHIEANHIEGVSLPCNYCDKTFRTRSALRFHHKVHSSVEI